MTEYLIQQLSASALGWIGGAITTYIIIHHHKEHHR